MCGDTTHFIADCPKRKKFDYSNKNDYNNKNDYKKKNHFGDNKRRTSRRYVPSMCSLEDLHGTTLILTPTTM
jgi:hypothetical protein